MPVAPDTAIDPAALLAALGELGLSAPIHLTPLGRPRLHARTVLQCPGTPSTTWLLVQERVCPGWDTLESQRCALTWLQDEEDVPVPPVLHRLRPGPLGPASGLLGPLSGVPASHLLARGRLRLLDCGTAAGQVRSALDALPRPQPATLPTADWGFVAHTDGWRSAWLKLHRAYTQLAHRGGVDLGPLQRDVLARFEDRIGALDSADRWALVHRDLQPAHLWLDPESLALRCVVGWTGSFVGDPLVDWVQPLHLGGPYLRAFGKGAGDPDWTQLSSPEARARLDCYSITRALGQLAMAGLPGQTRLQRAQGLELARAAFEGLRSPDWVHHRLDASPTSGDGALALPRISARARTQRAALDAFTQVPVPTGDTLSVLLTAMAWSLGPDSASPGPAPTHPADRLIAALAPALGPAAVTTAEGAVDTERWATRVLQDSRGDGGSAVLLWLVDAIAQALPDTVSHATRSGVDAALTARLNHEVRMADTASPLARLVGGLAWLKCAERWPQFADSDAQRAQVERCEEAWDRLCPLPPSHASELADAAEWPPPNWVPTHPEQGQRLVLWRLLHALDAWPLRTAPGLVWAHLAGGQGAGAPGGSTA